MKPGSYGHLREVLLAQVARRADLRLSTQPQPDINERISDQHLCTAPQAVAVGAHDYGVWCRGDRTPSP